MLVFFSEDKYGDNKFDDVVKDEVEFIGFNFSSRLISRRLGKNVGMRMFSFVVFIILSLLVFFYSFKRRFIEF